MKKVFLILFAFFYLIVASGISLNIHYCGGKIKNLSFLFSHSEKDCCGSSKMKTKDCCKEKAAFIKVKENQESSRILKTPTTFYKLLCTILPQLTFYCTDKATEKVAQNYHAPPVFYDSPLYLQHRVLLI